MRALISICIPTFNRATYLSQSLQSMLNNKNLELVEIIISDNQCTDFTAGVVNKFSNKFRIIYNKNQSNIGAVRNLIKATEFANGEYVWLWGDDDVMFEGAIDNLCSFLNKNPDVDYVFYPRVMTDKELNPMQNSVQPKGYNGNIVFSDGGSLLSGLDRQMFGIMGFFSSTIIRKTIWKEAKKELENETVTEFHHLKIILRAIRLRKCVVFEKPGVYCRLNYRGFGSHNSKVWFDDYIKATQFAKELGYPKELCDNAIKKLITSFSKMFVVDKAKGHRKDNISSAAKKLGVSHLMVKSQPWYTLSFFPSKLLNLMMMTYCTFRSLLRDERTL